MYEVGQMIVYGTRGVCRVAAVSPGGTSSGGDAGRLYYTLEPLYQSCVIYAPVDGKVFMRPVITREEAEQLIDSIPDVQPEACFTRDLRELKEHYEASIFSHDCAELVALSMSIYEKRRAAERQKRRLNQTDERFMKQAEQLLFGELATALGIPSEQVPDYISKRVGSPESRA